MECCAVPWPQELAPPNTVFAALIQILRPNYYIDGRPAEETKGPDGTQLSELIVKCLLKMSEVRQNPQTLDLPPPDSSSSHPGPLSLPPPLALLGPPCYPQVGSQS